MTRLVTSGCSFTDYCWSTWADYLSYYFTDYVNVGNAGSDNANIARNVLQTAQSGDTVVLLWSGWNRQNFWRERCIPTPKNADNHWDFHWIEQANKSWITEFYHPIDRAIVSMDYVNMIDTHSRFIGYKAYHFAAFPWLTGELEKKPHDMMEKILSQYNIQNNFLLNQSLREFRDSHSKFIKIYDTKYNQADRHPGPLCHYEFLIQRILPNLGIEPNHDMRAIAENYEHMVDLHLCDIKFTNNDL